MHRDIAFNIEEGLRNIRLLPRESLLYFIFLLINHILIIIFFSIYVNLNFMKEISLIDIDLLSFNVLLPIRNKYDRFLLIFFIIALIFIFLTIYSNKTFIKQYLKLNSAEIKLIIKLKGKRNLVRTPIIYSAFLINFFSMIIILSIIKIPYRILFNYINIESKFGLKLLEYNCFNISLFAFLFLITFIVVVSASYLLFWDLGKK